MYQLENSFTCEIAAFVFSLCLSGLDGIFQTVFFLQGDAANQVHAACWSGWISVFALEHVFVCLLMQFCRCSDKNPLSLVIIMPCRYPGRFSKETVQASALEIKEDRGEMLKVTNTSRTTADQLKWSSGTVNQEHSSNHSSDAPSADKPS